MRLKSVSWASCGSWYEFEFDVRLQCIPGTWLGDGKGLVRSSTWNDEVAAHVGPKPGVVTAPDEFWQVGPYCGAMPWLMSNKATGNSRSGIPGNRGPQNSRREYPGISEILAWITGNFASFVFFSNFPLLIKTFQCLKTAFWAKPWMTSLTQLFVFIEFQYTLKSKNHWTASEFRMHRSLHEWGRWDNSRPRFCIHRPGMEGSGVSVSVFDVGIGIRYRYCKISRYRYRYSVFCHRIQFLV